MNTDDCKAYFIVIVLYTFKFKMFYFASHSVSLWSINCPAIDLYKHGKNTHGSAKNTVLSFFCFVICIF